MTEYLWQSLAWPQFRWDAAAVLTAVAETRLAQGRLLGRLEALGFQEEARVEAEAVVQEALKTSEIEGERLSRDSVRSSVARRLGLDAAGLPPPERNVDGLVEMLLDATNRSDAPLTAERLKGWHAALFPTGYSGLTKITVADWRPGPIQVVSGRPGRERVHYEAPPAVRVPEEMGCFLSWWVSERGSLEGLLRAGVAHLWFETIHPFDDGNGRLGRAVAEMALAQAEGSRRRCYSLSAQISAEREAYDRALEEAQFGGCEITDWLFWFVGCVKRAVERSAGEARLAVRRALFWQRQPVSTLSARQVKVVNRLLEAGPGGFEGGLTNRTYRGMTKASAATALRDLQDLADRGILVRKAGGGRSTSYDLPWDEILRDKADP
ncbi:MAG: Fic family protein [Deltaproteobacteria bacterium]|nr:Fic family protein [Deltaproteobacteria bacterium]